MKEGIKERREEACKVPDASLCIADGCVGSTASSSY